MEPRPVMGSTQAVVYHVDNENHRIAWIQRSTWLAYFLQYERWQWLTVVEDEDGTKTKYDTLEVFNGPFAYFIQWTVGPSLRRGVKAMAEGLKRRTESAN